MGEKLISFNESNLEDAFIALFKEEKYEYVFGEDLKREIEDVILEDDLKNYLLNKYSSEDITLNEVTKIITQIKNISYDSLYETNKKFFEILTEGFNLQRDDKTKADLYINIVDFENIENNLFKFVNQFKIKGFEFRIPDGIVFINGLPLVVFEFKSAIKTNTTIFNAYEQLTVRYARDIPELFKYNAFIVISDGVNNKYGTLFTEYEFFYSWKKINREDNEYEGIDSALSLVKGMFNKSRLLKIINDFIYFPDNTNSDKKIICRYPQYYAVTKLHDNILKNIKPKGEGKGGTYFGSTGSGKSLAMLFLSRILMKDKQLKNPTILLITDRTDLERQLSKLFVNSKNFLGDNKVKKILSRNDLKEELKNRLSGGVYLTNIQKFTEDIDLLSERSNIICISDEAHRSQLNLEATHVYTENGVEKKYGFAKYLHDSLPNAVYVGFTGTPIDETIDVFGEIVDSYTMTDAVEDGIIVNMVYDGRAARVNVDNEKVKEIEDYYKQCAEEGANEYQIEASKKAILNINTIIGDSDRLQSVAEDFIELYEQRIEEQSTVKGKAMFVCASRSIAYEFYKKVINLRPEWAISKYSEEETIYEEEKRTIKKMPKIKMIMTRNKDDEKELYDLLSTKEDRESFADQFKNEKSNFKIAIVVDMWITGFDVPCLDTIFIDKPIKKHTLIQTISRVNRVYEGKEKGLIIDYIGIYKAMNDALRTYTNFEKEKIEDLTPSITIVKDQLSILDSMFYNFNTEQYYEGTALDKLNCLKDAAEYVQITEKTEKMFMRNVKRLKSAYDLCVISDEISKKERDEIFFYTGVRSIIYKLTKGDAPDISKMNRKVIKMVEEAILSDGVEDVLQANKNIHGIDLLSEDYINKINQIPRVNTKIKILERLMRNEIKEYGKVNRVKAKAFSEKLNDLIDFYNRLRNDKQVAEEVFEDVISEIMNLVKEFKEDKCSFESLDISFEEKAFYDILKDVSIKHEFEYPHEKLLHLAKEIKKIVEDNSSYVDWDNREDIKANLKVDLILLLDKNDYPPEYNDEVFSEVFEQAENFKKYAKI